MPKTHDMLAKKFLRKEDLSAPVLWTVTGCAQYNVAKEGAEPENKWCLTFKESDKPLVLNGTNIQLCQIAFQSDDTDQWINKRLVLYVDPTVMYQGKAIGGIRVRKPKATAPPPVPEPTPSIDELDDDSIPF